MRAFKLTAVAGAIGLALAASMPATAQFSNAYFFGDSLTDAGSYKPVLPPGTGLFTTNPGPVWVTPFGANYGIAVSPANQGGNDYAYGGARVTELPGVPNSPPTAAAVPIATQISQFIAKGPIDRNAIYSVWGGANDIFYQLGLLQAGQITQAQLQTNVALAATQLGQQAAVLQNAGAKYLMVWNLPDIGSTPFGKSSGQGAQITAISQLYNTTLLATLDAAGVQAVRLNAYGLLNEILANPSAYGFQNATTPACGATASLICTSANLVAPNAAQTYVFADGVHPTTAAQAIEAQYAISVLNAPQQMAALGQAPLAVEQANWRTLDGRMVSGINAPRAQGKLEAWAAYDYSAPDYSGNFFTGSGDANTVAVGIDTKLSNNALAGVMFNYTENKADYGGMGFKLREPLFTVYGGYGDGPWYVGATFGAGGLDFDTTRDISLGAATRTETGTTKGYQYIARLMGGYWFKAGDWLHGPTVKLTYQDIVVRQFSENGSSATTMTFGQQEVQSFVTSAGWQLAGQIGAIRPFARATWEYEGKSDNRSVTASVYGMGGSFSMPAFKPDNNWGLFNVGASTEFGKVTGFITGSATAGKGDGDYYGITLGIRVPL
jgi:outer membrane lipase/esterase